MALSPKSQNRRASGSTRLLSANRKGKIDIHSGDLDVIVPVDVSEVLPAPFCTGILLFGTAGQDRVIVHFPIDRERREVISLGIKLTDQILSETFEPPEQQSTFTLDVEGDWHQLKLAGSKTLILSLSKAELKRHTLGANHPSST